MGLQVIFGTGPVGLHTAKTLLERGEQVRLINRTGSLTKERLTVLGSVNRDKMEVIQADATRADQVLNVAKGSSHIFHCINPLYHQWGDILPTVQRNMVEAALAENAILAASENLYMYGRGVTQIDIDTPIDPPTRKGKIRQQLHEELILAQKDRGLKWTTVRASDFFGPGSTDQSVFGTKYFLDPIFQGKSVTILGNPDMIHSYSYVGDFGRALATVAHKEKALGYPWIVANKEETTTRAISDFFMEEVGKKSKMQKIPKFMFKLLGLFDPVMAEIPEMLYQKEEPYAVSGHHLEQTFGFEPTPLKESIKETLDWYEASKK